MAQIVDSTSKHRANAFRLSPLKSQCPNRNIAKPEPRMNKECTLLRCCTPRMRARDKLRKLSIVFTNPRQNAGRRSFSALDVIIGCQQFQLPKILAAPSATQVYPGDESAL